MKFGKEPELEDVSEPPSRRGLYFLGIVLVAAMAEAGWYYWSANRTEVESISAEQTARQVWELENRRQRISAQLALLPADASLENRAQLLEEAVAVQNELRRTRLVTQARDSRRLHELQTELDDARGLLKSGRIGRLEIESDPLLRSERREEGIGLLKEALTLQREINASGATSAVKNYAREERLGQMLMRIEAEPLKTATTEMLARATAAAAEGRWPEALKSFQEARGLQGRLNREYGRTQFSDLAAIEMIDTEIASLGAAGLHSLVEENLNRARAAVLEGRDADAIAGFQLAAPAQRQINTQFAKSRFVSNERLQQIDAELQSVQAKIELGEVQVLDAAGSTHLQKREVVQAQKKIHLALEKLEALVARMPKARGMDSEQQLRLRYLRHRLEELGRIQDQVYDLLIPQPSAAATALLKTEVSQALFVLVMNSNPSRNLGGPLPVDSVNYAEAREFCRRLGWILGAAVRLPTEAEFQRALGRSFIAELANAWTAENSGGQSQPTGRKPANAAGFHDLIGNLDEWLAADRPDEETAPRIGGNFTVGASELASLPLDRAARTERSRTTGFRVVVEIDLRSQ